MADRIVHRVERQAPPKKTEKTVIVHDREPHDRNLAIIVGIVILVIILLLLFGRSLIGGTSSSGGSTGAGASTSTSSSP